MSDRPTRVPLLVLGGAAAAADLLTKWWVFRSLGRGETARILGDFLVFQPHCNPAGPWSMGHGLEFTRWLLPVVSVVAVAVLLRLLLQSDPADRVKAVGLTLILGGAAGNLWDRAWALLAPTPAFDGVRDFILFPSIVFGRPFPAFNLADTWITVGVALVAWRILFEHRGTAGAPGASGPPGASPPPSPGAGAAEGAGEVRP